MVEEEIIKTAEKQEIRKLFSEGIFTLEISKELRRDHQTTKKTIEKELRTQSKGKGFEILLPRDETKLK